MRFCISHINERGLKSRGLIIESAFEFLGLYFDMIENAYGDEAVNEFRYIVPSFKRLRDERIKRPSPVNSRNQSENQRNQGQGTQRRISEKELREAEDRSHTESGGVSKGIRQNNGVDDDPPRLEIR
jgi:hypothetical protein